MLTTIKSRRGVTLAELMVALGLVSIMIVMVVSFTILITNRTKANQASDAMRRDCDMIQVAVKSWMDGVSAEGVSITVPAEDQRTASVVAVIGEGEAARTYTLQLMNAFITGNLPSEDETEEKRISVRTETVTNVEFEVMKNGSDYLVFCYVTCQNPETKENVEYIFCINSRVGETIVTGGAQSEIDP